MTTKLTDDELDQLCDRLVWWCRTRRFYGRQSVPPSLLGRLAKRTRPLRPGGPDAGCSAQMAAMYIALIGQPIDALDRRVFELHYFHRVANVKCAAAAVGISRRHWYRLISDFRRRIHQVSMEVIAMNEQQLYSLNGKGGVVVEPPAQERKPTAVNCGSED